MSFNDLVVSAYQKLGWRWNGTEWENPSMILERRIHALEVHVNDMETRYSRLENNYILLETRLHDHSQGRSHAPRKE